MYNYCIVFIMRKCGPSVHTIPYIITRTLKEDYIRTCTMYLGKTLSFSDKNLGLYLAVLLLT